jgi:hypothetical protein
MGHLQKSIRRIETRYRNWKSTRAIVTTGFWFIDIPRTSSTSIRAELGKRFGPIHGKRNVIEAEHATEQVLPEHLSAREMQKITGPKAWASLYSFSIVRNPFERLLSFYNYMQKCGDLPASWSYAEFVARHVEATPATPYLGYFGLRRTACDFVLDAEGKPLVTEIFRFENRAEAITRIGQKIGFPELGTLHVQKASPMGQDYRLAHDDKTRALLEDFYARDLAYFGYSF